MKSRGIMGVPSKKGADMKFYMTQILTHKTTHPWEPKTPQNLKNNSSKNLLMKKQYKLKSNDLGLKIFEYFSMKKSMLDF